MRVQGNARPGAALDSASMRAVSLKRLLSIKQWQGTDRWEPGWWLPHWIQWGDGWWCLEWKMGSEWSFPTGEEFRMKMLAFTMPKQIWYFIFNAVPHFLGWVHLSLLAHSCCQLSHFQESLSISWPLLLGISAALSFAWISCDVLWSWLSFMHFQLLREMATFPLDSSQRGQKQ